MVIKMILCNIMQDVMGTEHGREAAIHALSFFLSTVREIYAVAAFGSCDGALCCICRCVHALLVVLMVLLETTNPADTAFPGC
jgi:hypothetical protein